MLELEMSWAELRVVLISMPPTVEAGVGVGIVNPKPLVFTDKPPLDVQHRLLWASRRDDAVRVDTSTDELLDDAIGFVLDGRDGGMAFQDVFQPFVDRAIGRS